MHIQPKLTAFDLDGTLAESKQPLDPSMGVLLAQLLEHMPVAVMSGASFAQFEVQFLPSLPQSAHLGRLYIFPNSAARCYKYEGEKWSIQYDHSFDVFERSRIMQALKEALAEVGLADDPEEVWGERIEDRGAQISFSALGQKAPVEAKKEWNRLYNEKRKDLHAALLRRIGDFSVRTGGLTSIDITRQGINKAYGIRELVKMSQTGVAEMLYVGDALEEGGNDAVVIETGVHTAQVLGPADTAQLIEEILQEIKV